MFLRLLISLILGIAAGRVFHFFLFFFFNSYLISILVGILAYYLTYRSLKFIVTKKGSKVIVQLFKDSKRVQKYVGNKDLRKLSFDRI